MRPSARDAHIVCVYMLLKHVHAYIKSDYKNAASRTCGIFIDLVRPYLVPSPDPLISCSCSCNGVAEFKCPLIPHLC